MAGIPLSDALVDKARHALGLTRQNFVYRNYYVADDDSDWEDAVRRGIAVKRQQPSWIGGGGIYHVSAEAKFFFLNSGERVNDDVRFPASNIKPT